MAKANFGTTASDLRGKVGAVIYSRNRGGAYVKNYVVPTNPQTPAQTTWRGCWQTCLNAWGQALTEDQRDAWWAFAQVNPRTDIFGDAKLLTGQMMFMSLSTRLFFVTGSYNSDPPAGINVVTPKVDTLAIDVSVPSMTFEQRTSRVSGTMLSWVWATRAIPSGQRPQKNMFRYIASNQWKAAGLPFTWDVSSQYLGKGWSWNAGDKIALRIGTIDIASGATSPGVQLIAVST